MNTKDQFAMLAVLVSCLFLSTARAQSTPPAQSQQDQTQAPDQNSGVSHPPADETIQADEDAPPPVVKPAPKPSAAIPMTPARPVAPTVQADDPDYGIVTSVPATTDATLTKRTWNADDEIVNYVPSNPNELAVGTYIRVRLSEDLSTKEARPGEAFRAVVDRDVYKEGRVIIPAGAELRGHVVQVSQGHHLGPHATLRLRPETVTLPDGTAYHLYAEAVQSKAAGTRINDEGGIQASPHYKKDAIEYGAGTGAGAIAGGEIAGPVGAGVGSLVGAGVVTAHMLMARPAVANLPQGSMLVFSLTEPMTLTPTRN
jgi:hypothetical protein